MRLALKNISQEDKQKLLTDVFYNTVPGFLNGVDLSTKDGKQKYIDAIIAGKKPFKNEENSEDERVERANINLNTITPWSDIVRQADSSSIAPVKKIANSNSNPFDDALLNVAYSKKIDEIQMDTSLSKDEISEKLLEKYSNTSSAQKSILSAVKFLHNITSSIFTECDECGGENHPLWSICQHCGVSSDGVPVKREKLK